MKWIAFALLVFLLIGGAILGFFLAIEQKPVVETAEAYYEALTKPKEDEFGPVFIEVPPVIANLRHTANGRLIQLGLTLKTSRENRRKTEWLVPHFTETLHDYLRGLDEREIEGGDGMRKLKQDLVARAAAIDPNKMIDAVLIQRMVIQ